MTGASELVFLRGGLTVSADALRLLWRLENDHFTIEVRDGRLFVLPVARLTPQLAGEIRRQRDELIRLVQYEPDDSHLYSDSRQGATDVAS
jgi:hypothetical protein